MLGVSSGNNGEVSKRSDTSLKILQSVFPRVSSGLLTPLSEPDNLQAVVLIALTCTDEGLGISKLSKK